MKVAEPTAPTRQSRWSRVSRGARGRLAMLAVSFAVVALLAGCGGAQGDASGSSVGSSPAGYTDIEPAQLADMLEAEGLRADQHAHPLRRGDRADRPLPHRTGRGRRARRRTRRQDKGGGDSRLLPQRPHEQDRRAGVGRGRLHQHLQPRTAASRPGRQRAIRSCNSTASDAGEPPCPALAWTRHRTKKRPGDLTVAGPFLLVRVPPQDRIGAGAIPRRAGRGCLQEIVYAGVQLRRSARCVASSLASWGVARRWSRRAKAALSQLS